jgi:hypothetical protein
LETVDGVTSRLVSWIAAASGVSDVRVRPIAAQDVAGPVELRLHRLVPGPRPSDTRAPFTLRLHYLVSVSLPDVLQAQRILGEIAFAAMADGDFATEALPDDLPFQASLGLAATLTRTPVHAAVPRVRDKVVTRLEAMRTLRGVLLGPNDRPLVRAAITLANSNRSTVTDADGAFRIDIPRTATTGLRLSVAARGETHVVDAVPDGSHLTIRVPLEA